MAKESIDIEIINDKELTALFKELVPALQHKIVINGFKEAAQPIVNQAKQNLKSRTKVKKVSGINAVKVQKLVRAIGVKIGVENYKLRWLEWGTDERSYMKKVKRSVWRKRKASGDTKGEHKTGKIVPTNFFYDAFKQHEKQANNTISTAIKNSLNKTIDKYDKKSK